MDSGIYRLLVAMRKRNCFRGSWRVRHILGHGEILGAEHFEQLAVSREVDFVEEEHIRGDALNDLSETAGLRILTAGKPSTRLALMLAVE